MAPWEELPWFDLPLEHSPILTAGSVYSLDANPHRIALYFSSYYSNQVMCRPIRTGTSGSQFIGFVLSNLNAPLAFFQKDSPLCQLAWQVGNPSGNTVQIYVLEVTMARWPAQVANGQGQAILQRGPDGGPLIAHPTGT